MFRTLNILLLFSILLTSFVLAETKQDNEFAEFDGDTENNDEEFENGEVCQFALLLAAAENRLVPVFVCWTSENDKIDFCL